MNLSDITGHVLYDRVISVTFGRYDREAANRNKAKLSDVSLLSKAVSTVLDSMENTGRQVTIPFTGDDGMKPNIEVSLTMLPSGVCLNMQVILNNAALVKNIDINTFQTMSVTLGYAANKHDSSDYNTEVFTGPIFSSYIEKPAPNSRIVFEGVVTGETGVDLFSHSPYNVTFYESQYTIHDVCARIARAIGYKVDFSKCTADLYNRKLSFTDNKATADNKYALVNWLQSMLHNHFEYLNKSRGPMNQRLGVEELPFVYVYLNHDTMFVCSNLGEASAEQKRNAITLNAVKSASFQAVVLNVVALYNPHIHPGDVFYMPPVYYKGGTSLLNRMDRSLWNPDDGFYRALKIDIRFATYGNTNEMTIMALPVSLYQGDKTPEEIQQETEKWADEYKDGLQKSLLGKVTSMVGPQDNPDQSNIVFGKPKPPKSTDVPPKSMWNTGWTGWMSAARVKPESGLTLSQLAQKSWGSELFYLNDDQLTTPFNRNMPNGVPLYYFFPLIQVATYKNMKAPGGSAIYKIDINNPDMVWAEYSVAIPPLTLTLAKSYIGNTQVASIIKQSADFYNKLGYTSWAKALTDIYNYLTKGKRI